MTEAVPPLICPKNGEVCPMADLCSISNAPLVGAVERITTAPDVGAGGKDPKYAGKVLAAELVELGDKLHADFEPKVGESDAVICPVEVLQRDPPGGTTIEQVAAGIGTLASGAVDSLIRQLRSNYQGRQRADSPGKTTRRPD